MNRSWKPYVASMCNDAWSLDAASALRVIKGLEVLIATDQISDFAVAGVLSGVGVSESYASEAAPSIRATINKSLTPAAIARTRRPLPEAGRLPRHP